MVKSLELIETVPILLRTITKWEPKI